MLPVFVRFCKPEPFLHPQQLRLRCFADSRELAQAKYFGAAAPMRFCVSVRSPKTWGCVFQIPNYLGAHIRCLQGLDTHTHTHTHTHMLPNLGHRPCSCTVCCSAIPSLARTHPPSISGKFRRDCAKAVEFGKTNQGLANQAFKSIQKKPGSPLNSEDHLSNCF